MNLRVACTVVLAWSAVCAHSQIPLPSVPSPQVPQLELPAPPAVLRETASRLQPVVSSVRARARTLLQSHPRDVERDPRGAPVIRAVILALSPGDQALQQALSQGFQIQTDQVLQPLGDRVITLLVPRGLSTQRALRQLREADPVGTYDFDHLFVESGQARPSTAGQLPPAGTLPDAVDARVGLIDGGVDASHPAFATQRPEVTGCGGRPTPSSHGTAVASLFVGRSAEFHGAAPGARLHAVDIYCDGAAPGGRVRDMVLALGELMIADVSVINMSVVGPDNAVLRNVVSRVLARAIVVVAAAGNDGPNAAPLYPAAYPGVVAVTGVDARERVLIEACGGAHLGFAAPGADMLAAANGGGYAPVRGTSYAAPLVAGLIASRLAQQGPGAADRVVKELAAAAVDRGRQGRDRQFGYGVVGMDLRTDPSRLMDGSREPERRAQ